MAGKILVIGSSNTDMIIKSNRIPREGETVTGGTYFSAAGGKGANQAVAAARAGGDVTFIAKVGRDDLGNKALEGYKKESMNIEHIFVDNDSHSGVALILVDEQGQNSISVAPGANAQLLPEDILPLETLICEHEFILMQLEMPLETVQTVAKMVAGKGIKVVLDPAPAQDLPDELLKHIHIITPNETEAELLTGIVPADQFMASRSAGVLKEKGLEIVLITMGEQGTLISDDTQEHMVDAFKVDAVDSTAAGDVFNGSLMVALSEGKDWDQAITFANAAAAISVTRMGAQPSIPQRSEIDEFLKEVQ